MGLSDIDSNKYDAIIRFKKSLKLGVDALSPKENVSSNNRKINDFGEPVASKVQQEQKRLNSEEIQLLVAEYQSGKSTYQLAKQFGCHRTTVGNALKKHGVTLTARKDQKVFNHEDIIAMYANMHTINEIAEKYGVGPNVINRCLREHGVKIRGRWGN